MSYSYSTDAWLSLYVAKIKKLIIRVSGKDAIPLKYEKYIKLKGKGTVYLPQTLFILSLYPCILMS